MCFRLTAVIIMICIVVSVSSKVVFRLKLLRYEANEDKCCDGVNFFGTCNECDPYFQVCIRQKDTGKELCQDTSRENDRRLVDLTSSNISPTTFVLPLDKLERNVTVSIKTKDYDATSGDDDMDSLGYTFAGLSLFNPVTVVMNGAEQKYHTRITVEGRITCDQYYYGPSCDIFCKNESGSFCDANGTKTEFHLTDAINVNCDEFGWDIGVDIDKLRGIYPGIKTSDVYLGKSLCTGMEDGTMLKFKQGLRECLTSETISGEQLIYNNELLYAIRDPVHSFIIRRYNWTVQVECDVSRNETATGHLLHDLASNKSLHMTHESHYAANMSFYTDPNFMTEISGNPLHVQIGSDVFVKVFSADSRGTVKMVVQNCYTKSSSNATNETNYYLIKNGCEVDVNTNIISQTDHEMKFVFQDFQYQSSHEGLYLACDAVFCSSSDNTLPCQQKCKTVFKRSILTKEELEYISVTKHIVHL